MIHHIANSLCRSLIAVRIMSCRDSLSCAGELRRSCPTFYEKDYHLQRRWYAISLKWRFNSYTDIFLQFLYEYLHVKYLEIEMVCRWIISILLTRHLLVVIKLLKQHINIFVVQGYRHLQRFGLFSMWQDFSKPCFWCFCCFQEDVPVERPSSGSQSEKKSKAILARTTTPGMVTDQVCNHFFYPYFGSEKLVMHWKLKENILTFRVSNLRISALKVVQ